jgi:RNA polymerase I-specific transcription initiation factor RRN3
LDNTQAEGSSKPLTRSLVFDRLHSLLRHLLSLVPTLPNALQPLLARHFPHKRMSQATQVCYIRNILRLSEYCPELGEKIMAIIVDRAIQIDVEIQVESEDVEQAQQEDDLGEVFELDPFDTVIGEEEELEDEEDDSDVADDFSDLSSEADSEEEAATNDASPDARHVQDMVSKLDSILTLVFDHYHRVNSLSAPSPPPDLSLESPRPDSPSSSSIPNSPRPATPMTVEQGKHVRRIQFLSLLAIFDRTILRTFKSRYTQFLLFWYSSLDPEYADTFQGMLVDKALLAADQPMVTRAAAASYIASFVSRAQFVDGDSAVRVVNLLCDYLKVTLDRYESQQFHPGAVSADSAVFYAVAQAVFLIFCFRWRDLQQQEDAAGGEDDFHSSRAAGKTWIPNLAVLQRVVTSPMNTLKVCSRNVVMQFARVAQATDFIYCYSILDANRRSDYASSSASAGVETPDAEKRNLFMPGELVNAELSSFFPFDPYKLPKSSSYIQGVYREWSAVAIDMDDDEDEEDSDEEEEEEEEKSEASTGRNIPAKAGGEATREEMELGASFGGMSISPVRPGIVVVPVPVR